MTQQQEEWSIFWRGIGMVMMSTLAFLAVFFVVMTVITQGYKLWSYFAG